MMLKREEIVSHYYVEHRQELLAYVSKCVAYSPFSEDIVQNIFLRLLTSDKMITPVTLPALVYTIARNLISDYWRHKAHVNHYSYIVKSMSSLGYYETESAYSAKELLEIIEGGVVKLLNDNQQVVYRLNTIDGLKVSEISTMLCKPYKTIEFQLSVARKQMRNYVKSVV